MKNIYLFLLPILIVAFLMAGCKSGELDDNPVSSQSNDIGNFSKSNTVHKELALAKSATAKYHNIDKAIEDGYVDINVVVQNMGYHLLNFDNWDTFDPGKPALLVYSKDAANGKMRLVAVEYAVPNGAVEAPEGFAGNDDVWEYDSDIGRWECHAWVWYNNPDGIFSKYNPRVHVNPDDVNHP